jgi:hypothetical protein
VQHAIFVERGGINDTNSYATASTTLALRSRMRQFVRFLLASNRSRTSRICA